MNLLPPLMVVSHLSAISPSHQIFCVVVFLTAVSFFGTLISELNEIVTSKASLCTRSNEASEGAKRNALPCSNAAVVSREWTRKGGGRSQARRGFQQDAERRKGERKRIGTANRMPLVYPQLRGTRLSRHVDVDLIRVCGSTTSPKN
jgi:hypothetical protein